MNTRTRPAALDEVTRLLIAQYTLGSLQGNEERKVRDLVNTSDEAAALALHWETVLLSMADRLPPVTPDPLVLARIQRTLNLPRFDPETQPLARPETPPVSPDVPASPPHERVAPRKEKQAARIEPALTETHHAATQPVKTRRRTVPLVYRRPMVLLAAAALAGSVWLGYTMLGSNPFDVAGTSAPKSPAPAPAPQPVFFAVLQPPGSSSTPGWILTQTGQQHLRAEPRLQSQVSSDQALALWARTTDSAQTQFLGWLNDAVINDITLPDTVVADDTALFEITLEKSDADTRRPPEGDVLFIGQGVKTLIPPPRPPEVQPAQPR